MSSFSFILTGGSTGDSVSTQITLTEDGNGNIIMTVTQLGDPLGDFSGIWFDVGDDALEESLTLTALPLDDGSVVDYTVYTGQDTVNEMSNGNNLNGVDDPIEGGGFDYGIDIDNTPDTQDDLATISFLISAETNLSLDDFMEVQFGIRIQSVGIDSDGDGDGDGGGSFKQVGISPRTYTIDGVKYLDKDGDGTRDAGEAGLGGVTIYIDANNNGVLDADELSTITADDGSWDIAGITQEQWQAGGTVREDVQGGYVVTEGAHGYALELRESYDFGNFLTFDITGQKYEDRDGNGTMGPNEGAPQVGADGPVLVVLLGLYAVGDGFEAEMLRDGEHYTVKTSDVDGSFAFTDLGPLPDDQEYEVRELGYYDPETGDFVPIDGSDWMPAHDPDGIDPVSGQDQVVTVGNIELGKISGIKYEDQKGDGAGGTDTPLEGWKMTLYRDGDMNGNGLLDSGEVADGVLNGEMALAITTTGADGSYSFDKLMLGSYLVKETMQTGWSNVSPIVVAVDGSSSGFHETADFYNFKKFSISGKKFEDLDGDGQRDDHEPGWEGVKILLLDAHGIQKDHTYTDANGAWSFDHLDHTADGYKVVEVLPDGSYQTLGKDGYVVDAMSGTDITGKDFGNVRYGKITGTKYEDLDADGAAGHNVKLPGWGVTLYLDGDMNGNGMLDAGEAADGLLNGEKAMDTDTTDNTGAYAFGNLRLGTYFVEEESRAGWTASTPEVIKVTGDMSGFHVGNVDFYNYRDFSISGWKWSDANGDGVWDDTETGQGGFTIVLDEDFDPTNGTLDSTTTAADGSYSFAGLKPGTYHVYELDQTGWQQTYDGRTIVVGQSGDSLASSKGTAEKLNFGNQELFRIKGYKWDDTDGDGVWDTGETGIEGWTIYLLDAHGNRVDETTTDAHGQYHFANLIPGQTYTVVEATDDDPTDGVDWTNTFDGSASVTGTAGQIVTATKGVAEDLNFGNFQHFKISGHKWDDYDGDGHWDAGEDGIEGWKIYLDDDQDIGNGVLAIAYTGADGSYAFSNLAPGTYYVSEDMRDGWQQTYPGDPDGIIEIVGESGAHFAGDFETTEPLNFGNHNDGPGVRTPGFWGSKFGKEFWNGLDDTDGRKGAPDEEGTARKMAGADGIVGTEDDAAFADYELVELGADTFTIGDGASAITLSLDLACKLIDASQKTIKNDGKWKLGRDMVATELNLRAGNPAGEADDLLNEAALWMQNTTNDKNGDGVISIREFERFSDAVLMDEFLWQEAQFGNENSAATLHDQLDLYNNGGDLMMDGIVTTMSSDGDLVFA